MDSDYLYHYRKSRQQASRIFRNIGIACWIYIAGLSIYQAIGSKPIPEDFFLYACIGLAAASLMMFYIMHWHLKHPASYEAIITQHRFIHRYPDSEQWSFDVKIADIDRFEFRRSLSHAGKGITEQGIVMADGRFYPVSMN